MSATRLALGDVGADVQVMQQRLKSAGIPVAIDGHFGEATANAVRKFQAMVGLVQDGIAGEKTLSALLVGKDPKELGQADIERAAKALGVDTACVLAVNEVESAGRGFGRNGKVKILFERHVFHDLMADVLLKLHGSPEAADAELKKLVQARPAIINPASGGYVGGDQEHSRLAAAMQINETAAIQSCSWGAFQIMGYHFNRLGFSSPAAMAEAMGKSEGAQLDAFVAFIKSDTALHGALKAKKWAAFAKAYNGPAYRKNLYDTKLQRAYEAHAGLGE